VSLGIFGDVFEVMTQVDLRMTKSTLLAGSLGLIIPTDNLGPTPLKQNLDSRFGNKIRVTLPNKTRVTRWKYLLAYISR
jgi:hypothetical protein